MPDQPADLPPAAGKPAYRVPPMAEVAAVIWNGLTVASLFAGCGGSSTGYRMAGYRVVWASEFVPAAQESYRANMAPGTILDGRDVRVVDSAGILAATGLKAGELDLLDGSPPCQAFSTAGKRERGWGHERTYEHGAKQRNEDLFYEYVRILDGLKPRAFVAENVSGLVKGVAKGYFIRILQRLKACGYRVEARVLDAQWLGVPQQRQRVIFVGVRDDLKLDPAFPLPLPYRYSVREAIPWIAGASVVQGTGNGHSSARGEVDDLALAAPTIITKGTQFEVRPETVLVVGDPAIPQRVGNSFPRGEVRSLDQPAPVIHASGGAVGGAPCHHLATLDGGAPYDERPAAVEINTRGKRARRSKLDEDMTDEPARAVRSGTMHVSTSTGMRSADEPAPTVLTHGRERTGSEMVVAGPAEKRKFTIAELRRICSFPDDFILTGSYNQQWERLGNSVPPLMMRAIAEAVRDRVLLPARAVARTAAPRRRSRARSTSG